MARGTRIAIIPARIGSKRLPRKNVRVLVDRPIIQWVIEAARASRVFDRVVVSTESDEVAEVAERAGADVPFRRPDALADDYTGTREVVAHAIGALGLDTGGGPDGPAVCCLYATAALVAPSDIARALGVLDRSADTFVFSALVEPRVWRSLKVRDDGSAEPVFPQWIEHRSQDLPGAVLDAGQFYWASTAAWTGPREILAPGAVPFPIPRSHAVDVDSKDDWSVLEALAAPRLHAGAP